MSRSYLRSSLALAVFCVALGRQASAGIDDPSLGSDHKGGDLITFTVKFPATNNGAAIVLSSFQCKLIQNGVTVRSPSADMPYLEYPTNMYVFTNWSMAKSYYPTMPSGVQNSTFAASVDYANNVTKLFTYSITVTNQ